MDDPTRICKARELCLDSEDIKKLGDIVQNLDGNGKLYTKSKSFRALSEPTRLKILYLLKHGDLYVCEIITALNKPQSTVSHHLNVLKNADFIKSHKEGIWIKYGLKNHDIIRIIEMITE
ncbi:ArsR/SmtB family transcription factor [Methanobacterium aggregans]|uniref:ArsR/SmtB family transcription factor n=1 Tax=Methanobacterium aggregans TaxID=1615586 RepID=UPI00320DCB86